MLSKIYTYKTIIIRISWSDEQYVHSRLHYGQIR